MEVVNVLPLICDLTKEDEIDMKFLDALAIVRDLANENIIECYGHDDALEEVARNQEEAVKIVDILLDVLRKEAPVIIDPKMEEPDLFLAKAEGKL